MTIDEIRNWRNSERDRLSALVGDDKIQCSQLVMILNAILQEDD